MGGTTSTTGSRTTTHSARDRGEAERRQIPLDADHMEADGALDAFPVLRLLLIKGLSCLQVGDLAELGFKCLYLQAHGRSPLIEHMSAIVTHQGAERREGPEGPSQTSKCVLKLDSGCDVVQLLATAPATLHHRLYPGEGRGTSCFISPFEGVGSRAGAFYFSVPVA
jgi:hypothetical protein